MDFKSWCFIGIKERWLLSCGEARCSRGTLIPQFAPCSSSQPACESRLMHNRHGELIVSTLHALVCMLHMTVNVLRPSLACAADFGRERPFRRTHPPHSRPSPARRPVAGSRPSSSPATAASSPPAGAVVTAEYQLVKLPRRAALPGGAPLILAGRSLLVAPSGPVVSPVRSRTAPLHHLGMMAAAAASSSSPPHRRSRQR